MPICRLFYILLILYIVPRDIRSQYTLFAKWVCRNIVCLSETITFDIMKSGVIKYFTADGSPYYYDPGKSRVIPVFCLYSS